MVHVTCMATVGQVCNLDHENHLASARRGVRAGSASGPHNRGVTMNPVDHPMGGGEGAPRAGGIPALRGAS